MCKFRNKIFILDWRSTMLSPKLKCQIQNGNVLFWLLSMVFLALGQVSVLGQTPDIKAAKALSNTFAAVAKTATPAVVSIKVEKTMEAGPALGFGSPFEFNDPSDQFNDEFLRKFFGGRMPQQRSPQKFQQKGQGSGFIIDKTGYILTNNHVVGDVDNITVELQDGRKFEHAKLIGTDPDSEVALIKIEGDNFPVLPMGDSEKMQVGDWVMAIGNPFGLSETVTVGVISAVGRSNVHIAAYEDFIQTDAAINPGNSGGPLINLDGQVIGINTAIASQSGGYMGVGFAIPINMAKSIEEQLIKSGKVTRGYLGLAAQDVTAEMAQLLGIPQAEGAIVAEIVKDSPADKAGLQSNDILLEMDGKKITSYDEFRNEVAMLAPDTKIQLQILRNNKKENITLTIGERPTSLARAETSQESTEQLGLQVQNLTQDLADQLGYSLGEGVIVTGVTPGSAADNAGIQAGDLILGVNQKKVNSVDNFDQAIKQSQKDKKVILLVKHGEYSRFVVIPLE